MQQLLVQIVVLQGACGFKILNREAFLPARARDEVAVLKHFCTTTRARLSNERRSVGLFESRQGAGVKCRASATSLCIAGGRTHGFRLDNLTAKLLQVDESCIWSETAASACSASQNHDVIAVGGSYRSDIQSRTSICAERCCRRGAVH